MIHSIIEAPFLILQTVLTGTIHFCVCLILLYGLLNRTGIVNRLVQRWIEVELGKEINGVQISISSIELDLFQIRTLSSSISIRDLVIHTPHRSDWRWDAPIIAQVGTVHLRCNLLSLIKLPPFLRPHGSAQSATFRPVARDIYSVRVRNVQVFVEKRRNVFNFHLLDKRLDVPDPREVLASMGGGGGGVSSCDGGGTSGSSALHGRNAGGGFGGAGGAVQSSPKHRKGPGRTGAQDGAGDSYRNDGAAHVGTDVPSSRSRCDSEKSGNGTANAPTSGTVTELNDGPDDSANSSSVAETKANEIVKRMIGAVSSLGRAANEGGTEEISNVLMNHKDGVVSYLKKFQNMVGTGDSIPVQDSDLSANDRGDDNRPISRDGRPASRDGRLVLRTTMIAKEGIQLMKHVGKVVEKNVLDMKSQVDSLAQPPPRKEGLVMDEHPDLFRIGWIIIQDIRIFSKDIILVRGSSAFEDSGNTEGSGEENNGDDYQVKRREQINSSGWSKPILVKEVVIHPTELCNSSLEKDGDDALVIGQPIEHILQVVLIKTLKEVAKCNTGQLFNNAFSEVFAWFGLKRT